MKVLSTSSVDFRASQREYDVLDRNSFETAPKYFVSYNKGRPFISDEVPAGYREPMVFHELIEFESSEESDVKCLKALKAELKRVPSDKLKDYMGFRHEVFRELIGFLETHDANSQFIPRAKKSLDYLLQHK